MAQHQMALSQHQMATSQHKMAMSHKQTFSQPMKISVHSPLKIQLELLTLWQPDQHLYIPQSFV